jgi:predicted porin
MYAFGETAGSNSANRLAGGMLMYKNDVFSVGAGYNTRNNELGDKSLSTLTVGGSVNAGPGTVSMLYGSTKDDHPTGLSGISALLTPTVGAGNAALVQNAFIEAIKQDGRLYHIGYRLGFGASTVSVAYSRYDDKRPNNADVSSYGAVYSYAFSKRTDVNLVLTHFDNKNLAQAAPGQAGFLGGVTESAGKDSNNVALGIRHRF